MRRLFRSRGRSRKRPGKTKSSGWLQREATLCSRSSWTSSGSSKTRRSPAAVFDATTDSDEPRRSTSRQRRWVNSETRNPPRHDRRRKQRAVRAGGLEQRLDLLTAQARPPGLRFAELLHLGLHRVVVDQLVADGDVEDLAEPGQRLVDRPVRERALNELALALLNLRGLVAIDLLRRDLGELVLGEERQHVVAESERVVLDRPGGELPLAGLEPLGSELMEGRLAPAVGEAPIARGRPPDPTPNVRQDVRELLLRPLAGPTLVRRS